MRAVSKTFRLKTDVVEAVEARVASGRAPTMTAMVEQLVRQEKLRLEMRQEEDELDRQWAAAMADPSYREEMHSIHAEFESADAESARQIE